MLHTWDISRSILQIVRYSFDIDTYFLHTLLTFFPPAMRAFFSVCSKIYRRIDHFLSSMMIACIDLYQKTLSPDSGIVARSLDRPPFCKHYPTCSAYGREAFERHGFVWGCILTTRRVLSCHPWSRGWYDPVTKKSPREEIEWWFSRFRR